MGAARDITRERIERLEQDGLYEEAIALMRVATNNRDNESPFLMIKLVLLLSKAGRAEDALLELRRLSPAMRKAVPLLLVEAKCYLELGDEQSAAKAQLEAFRREPNIHRGRSLLMMLVSLDWLEEAGEVAEILVDKGRGEPDYFVELLDGLDQVLNFPVLYVAALTDAYPGLDVDRLKAPRARKLAKAMFDVAYRLMEFEPSSNHVTSFHTISTILGMLVEAKKALEDFPHQTFSVLAKISDIYDRAGDAQSAREFYEKAMCADSAQESTQVVEFSEGPPLVILHRGEASFMQRVLKENRRSNPDQRIIVLGDDYNRVPGIEYHRWSDYRRYSGRLVKAYRHQSVNAFPFELLCMERWAVLLDFCEKWGLEEVIHLDSDVILYEPIVDSLPLMRGHKAAICGISPHVGYFRVEELAYAYEVMCSFFENPSRFPKLGLHGNCSDMIFLGYAAKQHGWGCLLERSDGAVFDHHLGTADGFEFQNNQKCFQFVSGQPYVRCEASGELIRFRCIHFQGRGKALIEPITSEAYESSKSD